MAATEYHFMFQDGATLPKVIYKSFTKLQMKAVCIKVSHLISLILIKDVSQKVERLIYVHGYMKHRKKEQLFTTIGI